MKFLLANGAPACFAVDRDEAEYILKTAEVQEIPFKDLSQKDLANIPNEDLPDYEAGFVCFAVAC